MGAGDAWRRAAELLQDKDRRKALEQSYLRLQQLSWGLVVVQPQQLYDRQYEGLIDRTMEKIRQVETGGDPAVARTIAEMGVTGAGEADDGGA